MLLRDVPCGVEILFGVLADTTGGGVQALRLGLALMRDERCDGSR